MGNKGDRQSEQVPLRAGIVRNPWALVVLLFLSATGSYLCRVNISVVGALMMGDLGFSQIDMGHLFSAFVLGYALFQIPAGAAADRWGARLVLGSGAFTWVLATAGIAALGWGPLGGVTVSAFVILLCLRFILGVAESPTFPAAAQGVAQWIAPVHQGFANGIVLTAVGAGSAIAPAVLSRVMVHWGWRIALLSSAVPALLVACMWMVLRGASRPSPRRTEARITGGHSETLWSRSFVLLTLSYTLEGYVGYIFIFWFYLYLVDVRHFDLLRAGSLSSLPGLLSLISIPMGGFISDRLVTGPMGARWGRRVIPMLGLSLSAVFLVLGARTDSAGAAVVYLALAMASVLSVEGPFWATMMEVARARSGTAGGVMNCGSNIGGMISPALTPILAALMGWKHALYVAAGLSFVAAGLWLGISPSVSEDNLPPKHLSGVLVYARDGMPGKS
jgi:MFS transporter, ACS family, glucarate transporter